MRSSPSPPIDPLALGRRDRLLRLIDRPFAHRGLHGQGRVENSLAAFDAALAAGMGFELDVQETADGHALVFHDYVLERLTGRKGRVRERVAGDLAGITLAGTDEALFTLADLIRRLGADARILVEVKTPNRSVWRLCRAVLDAIGGRESQIAIMSFNPQVGAWFAHQAPEVLRGLVVSEADEIDFWSRMKGSIKRILSLARARPDFLAYDIRSLAAPMPLRLRAAGMPMLTWTVRSAHDLARARQHADQIIHELPEALWPR